MITLANIRRAIYNIQKRLSILEENGGSGGSSTSIDISGKQDVIDSTHKLASDLVDDSDQTNKFVTLQEKNAWNGKSNFSGNYNDLSNKPTIPSIWRGTQDEYDLIQNPDDNTIYIITPAPL